MLQVRVDTSRVTKGFSDVRRRQIPFATSLALTATAGHVGIAWQEEIEDTFDRPTPWTVRSVAIAPARKSNLVAIVYVKDIAAEYLAPYVDGGVHSLGGKRGLLSPKNVRLNQYGNLTRNRMGQLKGRADVFIGQVQVKGGGSISGVWQRKRAPSRKVRKNMKGPAALKLLIRFSDPLPVKEKLEVYDVSPKVVGRVFAPEFASAFNRAMATAK